MDEEQKEPDEQSPEASAVKPSSWHLRWQRFKKWYLADKKKSIPLTILVLILVLAVVPWTRYKAAGVVIKRDFTVEILDSTSDTPVSGATLSVGSASVQTDGNGKASLYLSAGHHPVLISKKYYRDRRADVLVPIWRQKSVPEISLVATGRQAKIVVKNLVNQNALSSVNIQLAGTSAKTDKNGTAIVVVPIGQSTLKAKLSLDGYNDADVTVKVSNSAVAENDFSLTPTGNIYFLSKRTGKLNLMKASLDGSSVKIVLAATGFEHDYDTVISASPDWQYVALVVRRSASDPTPQLYVLSAADDKLLSVDSGNAGFTLVGWSNSSLIYYVTRNDIPTWQSNRTRLKSYDAGSGKTTLLDQTTASGDASGSAYEYYAFVSLSTSTVVYAKNWTQSYGSFSSASSLDGKQDTISTIAANGQNHKAIASYDANANMEYVLHAPAAVYIWQQLNSADKFYDFTIGLSTPKEVQINRDQFFQGYPAYYSSPSGKQTFWAENRDGKNSLFVGDPGGNNASTIATLSEYSPYGWYSDDYLMVSKGGSELYIMSVKGGKAVKITDYQPTTFAGGY